MLERFGPWLLDRPCPAAVGLPQSLPQQWKGVSARYVGNRAGDGCWSLEAKKWSPPDWELAVGEELGFSLQLAPLPSGQVGVFPEQYYNWQWIRKTLCQHQQAGNTESEPAGTHAASRQARVLNLFAYTGGSTLAAAGAGAEVTHVDAAKGIVTRARANAGLSGMAELPIRWIVEDAVKFCQREVKRGNQYDAVILDPPSYGHGPRSEAWSIQRDLLPLLRLCGKLTSQRRLFVLASCHTPSIGPAELSAYLSDGLVGHCGQPPQVGTLQLETASGRRLSSGVFGRWPG